MFVTSRNVGPTMEAVNDRHVPCFPQNKKEPLRDGTSLKIPPFQSQQIESKRPSTSKRRTPMSALVSSVNGGSTSKRPRYQRWNNEIQCQTPNQQSECAWIAKTSTLGVFRHLVRRPQFAEQRGHCVLWHSRPPDQRRKRIPEPCKMVPRKRTTDARTRVETMSHRERAIDKLTRTRHCAAPPEISTRVVVKRVWHASNGVGARRITRNTISREGC